MNLITSIHDDDEIKVWESTEWYSFYLCCLVEGELSWILRRVGWMWIVFDYNSQTEVIQKVSKQKMIYMYILYIWKKSVNISAITCLNDTLVDDERYLKCIVMLWTKKKFRYLPFNMYSILYVQHMINHQSLFPAPTSYHAHCYIMCTSCFQTQNEMSSFVLSILTPSGNPCLYYVRRPGSNSPSSWAIQKVPRRAQMWTVAGCLI